MLGIDYIKCCDCLDGMKEIPDGSIDLTVTSPPYDNLRTYNGIIDQWCFEKFQRIAEELYRITKDGGVVVWIVGDATINGSETGTSFKQALYFKECGFNLHDTMIYEKAGCSLPSPNRYLQHFEFMFVFSKGKPKTYNLICDRENRFERWGKTKKVREKDGSFTIRETKPFNKYGRRYNIWKYVTGGQGNTTTDNIAHEHPAIFPEQLANDHIISWSNPGDVVFDPFLGSGTTAKMAVLNGRHYIGFEIEPQYLQIASERIKEAERALKGENHAEIH
jgi:site-specific DNA-methyltransferase (adenine-specific)